MGTSEQRARYESLLAGSHRLLYHASVLAETLGDEGAREDCEQILNEITRLTDDSISGRRRPRPKHPKAKMF